MAAELSQDQIVATIAQLDAQIATLTGQLGGGAGAAQFTDYKVGAFDVKGSQQLKQLLETREYYQGLLREFPAVANDTVSYDIGIDGRNRSDLLGDE